MGVTIGFPGMEDITEDTGGIMEGMDGIILHTA